MFKIISKQILACDVKRLDVAADSIAAAVKPGQFVVVVPKEKGKWIPLAVADADPKRGAITLIFKEVGSATRELGSLAINETVYSVTGPFGIPARIEKIGTVVCASTGIGTAQILPICRAWREAGNKVIGLIGARNRREVMLEAQMRLACHKVILATGDGLYVARSSVKDALEDLIKHDSIRLVYAVGDIDMMQATSELTRVKGIPTRVQLSPLIMCGRGLCGSCRVRKIDRAGGQTEGPMALTCQHGPEFDAHAIDFETVRLRIKAVEQTQEQSAESGGMDTDAIAKFFPGLLRKA